jgi:hypothetical protein
MMPVRPNPPEWAEAIAPRYIPPWFRAKQARVTQMARAGRSMADICKAELLDDETVVAWCAEVGVTPPPMRRNPAIRNKGNPFVAKHTDRAAEMMEAGMRDEDIAKTLGRSTAVVRVWRARWLKGERLAGPRRQRVTPKAAP